MGRGKREGDSKGRYERRRHKEVRGEWKVGAEERVGRGKMDRGEGRRSRKKGAVVGWNKKEAGDERWDTKGTKMSWGREKR